MSFKIYSNHTAPLGLNVFIAISVPYCAQFTLMVGTLCDFYVKIHLNITNDSDRRQIAKNAINVFHLRDKKIKKTIPEAENCHYTGQIRSSCL